MFQKVNSIFNLLFGFFVGIIFTFFSENLYSKPIISFGNLSSDLVHSFGNVSPEDFFLQHTATIYNNGSDTLKILDIKPGCSCVNASITSRAISPQDSATIYLYFNTKGYSNYVSKSIDFITNLPNSPHFSIFLEANVVHPISISPMFLIFPKCEIGISQTQSITISNTTDSTISILSSNASDSSIKYKLAPQSIEPKQYITFDVTYTPASDTVFRGGIMIQFDCPKFKTGKIYISSMPKKL